MDFQKLSFQANAWRINGVTAGSGPVILFLHGIGLSWKWWRPVLPRFAQEYTVCAIDLPGSGGSSPIHEKPKPKQYAELVTQAVKALGRGPAVVVGHSLGGYVAVNAATEGAHGIRALALVAPAGFGPVKNRMMQTLSFPVLGEVMGLTGRPGVRTLLNSMVYDDDSITNEMIDWVNLNPGAMEQFLFQLRMGVSLGKTKSDFIMEEVDGINVPVWIGWGKHDSVFPLKTGLNAAEALGVHSPRVFDRSGHLPQIEQRTDFEEALAHFIGRLPN